MGWLISIVLFIFWVILNGNMSDLRSASILIASSVFALSGEVALFSMRYMNIKKGEQI